jgi:hypothetical protein
MLKKSASLSCSFGLFGLSGLFGCIRQTRWTRQTGLVPDVQAIEVLLCRNGFSQPDREHSTSEISLFNQGYVWV